MSQQALEFLERTSSFAKGYLLRHGRIDIMAIGRTPDNREICIPFPFEGERDKLQKLMFVKSVFDLENVTMYVMVSEAWMSTGNNHVRPSEDPARIEVLTAAVVTDTERAGRIYEIKRDSNDTIIDLNLREDWFKGGKDTGNNISGLMTQLLSDTFKVPPAARRRYEQIWKSGKGEMQINPSQYLH